MLKVRVNHGPSTTLATISFNGFTATGEAKRCPKDDDKPDVGESLAIGRALQILGEDLEHYGITQSHRH